VSPNSLPGNLTKNQSCGLHVVLPKKTAFKLTTTTINKELNCISKQKK
jgi:hypothetical protein